MKIKIMKKTNFWSVSVLVAGIAFLATACNVANETTKLIDDTTTTVTTLTETATDVAQAESANYEIEGSSDYYIANDQTNGFKVKSNVAVLPSDSVTVTVVHPAGGVLFFPKTITIDFGTVGVLGKRGNKLKGKIIVEVSAKMTQANSKRTITFKDFYVNDNAVNGQKTVTFDGTSSWTAIDSVKINTTSGVIFAKSNRVRKITEGASTPFIFTDDKYEISGASSGVNKKGIAYSMTISPTKPLVLLAGWPFFVSGVVTTSTEKKTVDIDYGDGTKDAIATATYNGVSKSFNLKK